MAQELENKNTLRETADGRQLVYVRYEDGDDEELDIFDIITLCKKGLLILKKYIALLLVFLVIGGVLGFVKSRQNIVTTYTSDAVLFVDLNREDTEADTVNESARISMLANSFAEIVQSDAVLSPIAQKYGLEGNIRDCISVKTPANTQVLLVSVTDTSSLGAENRAQSICADIIDAGIASMDSVADYATIKVISPATEARQEIDDSSSKSVLSMAAIFLVLALVIVIVRELGLAYKAHEAAAKNDKKENS